MSTQHVDLVFLTDFCFFTLDPILAERAYSLEKSPYYIGIDLFNEYYQQITLF